MTEAASAQYQAVLARDRRFDGVFFVGVSTTGIYCRPVCGVKTPRRSSCTFYSSAAAAEKAGFRPCLRCRPELAPGRASVDARGRLAAQVVERIEDGALDEDGVEGLAADLGVSSRHLRRACEAELGVSPVELAQTQRLLLAKRLLTDTRMPVVEVAFASGFASLRRFNALFRERYRMAPTDLRRTRAPHPPRDGGLVFELAYRPPYDWPAILAFFGARAGVGVEAVVAGRYLRTFRWLSATGWLSVASPASASPVLRVEISASLAPAVAPVLARVKRAFDLAADPVRIASDLGDLARGRPGLRLPGSFDAFEIAVRAILGQQVTVKGASTLAARLSERWGEPIVTPFPELVRLTPTAERIAKARPETIAETVGLPLARARAIVTLAAAVRSGKVPLGLRTTYAELTAALVALPGIGDWTAEYVAMRALGWPDAFPGSDLGVLKALGEPSPARARARAEAFRPWRSYATLHLWESLHTTRPSP